MGTKDKIQQILSDAFTIEHLEIIDDSDKHAGHVEAVRSGGGHFSAMVVSNDFDGKNTVARHRMVYAALKNELKSEIHALALRTLTPQEYQTS